MHSGGGHDVTRTQQALAGACAGVAGTLLGFPLDAIKTRMQAQSAHPISAAVEHLSGVSIVRKMWHEDGARAFYRGMASPMLSLTILNTFSFTAYATSRALLKVSDQKVTTPGSFEPRILAAGALVGLTSSYISTPFELVKCQMQLHRTLPASTSTVSPTLNPYRSSVQAAIHIAKAHGLLTLWRGFMVNTVRESLFLAVYFFAYEHSKSAFSKLLVDRWHAVESQAAAIALAGGLSGACAWFISFPLDCIKSVVQGRPFSAAPTQSSFEIARQLFNARGIGGFYAGVLPSVARAFIVSGTRFSAYESALAHLKQFDLFGSHDS